MRPPDREAASRPPSLPWWFFPALAYASTVSAVWGCSMAACGGVLHGTLATLLTLCLMMFVSPDVLVVVLLVFATSAGVAFALSVHRWFSERRELLFFLLPVAALVIGVAVGWSSDMAITCSLGPWR